MPPSTRLCEAFAHAVRAFPGSVVWNESTGWLTYSERGGLLSRASCRFRQSDGVLVVELTVALGRKKRSLVREYRPSFDGTGWVRVVQGDEVRELAAVSAEAVAADLVRWLVVQGANAANGWPL